MLVRVPDPEGEHYAIWEGHLMIPLAKYGWVIMIQAHDRGVLLPAETFGGDDALPTTGLREALAFDTWARENPSPQTARDTFDEQVGSFNAYDRRWDGLVPWYQLTTVRSYLDRLQASVHCGPEFYEQIPFQDAARNSEID
jgi:hypothetical protein